jgi:hypothetical protein
LNVQFYTRVFLNERDCLYTYRSVGLI